MNIETFFTSIYGEENTGKSCIVNLDPVTGTWGRDYWFDWPKDRDAAFIQAEVLASRDVYFSPILYSENARNNRSGTNKRRLQVVFADADTCHPDNFFVFPSIVVQSSEGRWQCYWLLDEQYPIERLETIHRKMTQAHKHQGIDNSWNNAKLLRVPGGTNTKHGEPFKVTASSTGEIFRLADLEEAYAEISLENDPGVQFVDMPEELPEFAATLAKLPDTEHLQELIFNKPLSGDYSEVLWKLELELFRNGLTAPEVFIIAKHSKCNKYALGGQRKSDGTVRAHRKNPDGDLWREVLKAQGAIYQDPATRGDAIEPGSPVNAPTGLVPTKSVPLMPLLEEDERVYVDDQETFIDECVAWMQSGIDGDKWHMIGAAWMVLACVFGGDGYISPAWAAPGYTKERLNFWIMALGPTTTTKKTTIYNWMKALLTQYEKDTGQEVLYVSSTTPEAFAQGLAEERNGKVSLIHRDECQAMFAEFKNKHYMANADDIYTEVYSGRVPARKTRAYEYDEAEVHVNMYLLGVPDGVRDVMDIEYFRKGFLTRFTYVLADMREWDSSMAVLKQRQDDEGAKQSDKVKEQLNKKLLAHKNRWRNKAVPKSDKIFMGDRFPAPILATEEALDRMSQAYQDMMNNVLDSKFREAVEPATHRLAITMWKCAALMAMWHGAEKIELEHVLITLKYVERWFYDLSRMAASIVANDWERDLDHILAYLSKKGGRAYSADVYGNIFRDRRLQEFNDMVNALAAQGVLRVDDTVPSRRALVLQQ